VLQHHELDHELSVGDYSKFDELPFDFRCKTTSVIVTTPEGYHRLICKGAPESVFERCTQFEIDEEVFPMDPLLLEDLREEYDRLSSDGLRVLAIV
jgi:P-type Mg2+ transporter